MDKLKPCPFCGSEASSGVEFCESSGGDVKLSATIKCRSCGVYKRVIFQATEITLVPFDRFINAFEKVTTAWNRRVGEPNES